MTKLMEFKETLKPFEKIEQQIEFKEADYQVYFELRKYEGSLKKLVSFLDNDGKEVLSKELPDTAFIKPYTNVAKIYIVNTSEKEQEVEFRIVAGVRLL